MSTDSKVDDEKPCSFLEIRRIGGRWPLPIFGIRWHGLAAKRTHKRAHMKTPGKPVLAGIISRQRRASGTGCLAQRFEGGVDLDDFASLARAPIGDRIS